MVLRNRSYKKERKRTLVTFLKKPTHTPKKFTIFMFHFQRSGPGIYKVRAVIYKKKKEGGREGGREGGGEGRGERRREEGKERRKKRKRGRKRRKEGKRERKGRRKERRKGGK